MTIDIVPLFGMYVSLLGDNICVFALIYIHRMIHDYTPLSYESQSPLIQRARFNTDHPIATLDDHRGGVPDGISGVEHVGKRL